jgi:cold shock CspA family protein
MSEYEGVVRLWKHDTWGFIKSDDVGGHEGIFVHKSALKNVRTLEVGDRVAFRLVSDTINPGKVKAADVVLLPPK